ncbi:hypothetical protein QZH41_007680 [Actinostola sp. cb2023]|nr:hypothetical protein QZH41_007680 [Actinostola sp. cb2023]
MADLIALENTKKGKRRTRSSISSTESYCQSPELKKAKNVHVNDSVEETADSYSEDEDTEDTEDEVLTAFSMAEGVSKTLEEILLKLGKLDSIEESVHNIETTLSKLEVRTSKLESFKASASKDIEDMKQGMNFLDNKVDSSIYKLENEVKRLQDKVEQSRSKETVYEEQIEELKSKDLYLEAYSRRENIKFMNIREEEDENVEAVIRGFLQDDLNYSNYDLVEIQRIHRNGRRVGSKPRPILARFLRAKDCEEIISLGYKLKGTSYQMFRDLPYELVKKRKLQMPTYKKARQNKIPAAFSKSEPDKLYIRGQLWPVGQELYTT